MEKRRFTPNGDTQPIIDKRSEDGGSWGVYNETFMNYMRDFRHGVSAQRLSTIALRLIHKSQPLVVDAMAPTDVLVDLKTNILNHPGIRGVAIGLQEHREPEEIARDERLGITYLTGNLRENSTWEKLTQEVEPNSVDLFMERADGGLYRLPTRKLFYQSMMNRIWNLLSPDHGTAILQLPPADELAANGISLEKWVTRVQEAGITCEYVPWYTSGSDFGATYGMLFIEKNPSSLILPVPEKGDLIPDSVVIYPESIREQTIRLLNNTTAAMQEFKGTNQ